MARTHTFHSTVLREYDVRGVVGDTLSTADAYAVGRAFASIVAGTGADRVAVAYDGRLSSPELEAAVVEGVRDAGLTAVRVGRGPTPMLYFAVWHLETGGGIMITGSHNPPDYNGFKMMLGHGAFFGDQVQELGRIAKAGSWREGKGGEESHDIRQVYTERLARDYEAGKGLRVAWDCGNGATGDIMPGLARLLPGEHILLNETVDGTFPVHHPDPTVAKNLVQLQDAVATGKLDAGIGFDGDGDRIGIVDGQGRIVWGDQILALLARDVLTRHPGATIIADVKASQVLFDEIAKAGGKPEMYKTGHSLIKSRMAETGSPLAGEMSGHIFFGEKFYGFDDALYVAVRFLDAAARSGQTVSQLYDSLPQMLNTPEVRFDCADDRKFKVVDEVKARLQQAGATFSDIDGVRVSTDDGWWLLRASNTQPVLVARAESGSEAGLGRLKQAVIAALAPSGIEPPADF
jgi:phosphomannomutase